MEANDLKIIVMLIGTVGSLVAALVFVIRGPLTNLLDKQMLIVTTNQANLHAMLLHCQDENATARQQYVNEIAKRDAAHRELMVLIESLTHEVAQMNQRLRFDTK